jgi:hypothetical protein
MSLRRHEVKHVQDLESKRAPLFQCHSRPQGENGGSHSHSRSLRLSLQRAASRRYDMTGETGSYRYMAPEVFRHEPYNSKVVRHGCCAGFSEC